MSKGWICIHRQLQDCVIWTDNQPFDIRSAWIDLLLLVNHEDKTILFDYHPLVVKRGQYLTSVRKLCERWSWSKNRTLKYLRMLENLKMISRESDSKRTLITIENYDKFQDMQDTNEDTGVDTGVTTVRTQAGHGYATNNNDNNENNENKINIDIHKNIYPSNFDEFWNRYPRKQDKGQAYKCYQARLNDGYTEEQLLTACKNYADECESEKREKKYIKVGSTFLSVNEPFVEYLEKGGSVNEQSERRTTRDSKTDAEREAEIRAIIEYSESEEGRREDEELWADLRKV